MTRYFALIVFWLLGVLGSKAQIVTPDDFFPRPLMEAERVCSVLVMECEYLEELLKPKEKTFLLVKGELTEALNFNQNGLLNMMVGYESGSMKADYTEEYRYDSLGRLIGKKVLDGFNEGQSISSEAHTYWYREDGKINRRLIKSFERDLPVASRNLEETIWEYRGGELWMQTSAYPDPVSDPPRNWEFVRKSPGNLIILEFYSDTRSMVQQYWKVKLDSLGRTVRIDRYPSGGTRAVSSWRRKYDALGRNVLEQDSGDTCPGRSLLLGASKRENIYGPKGKLLRSVLTFSNGDRKILVYSYRYYGEG